MEKHGDQLFTRNALVATELIPDGGEGEGDEQPGGRLGAAAQPFPVVLHELGDRRLDPLASLQRHSGDHLGRVAGQRVGQPDQRAVCRVAVDQQVDGAHQPLFQVARVAQPAHLVDGLLGVEDGGNGRHEE